MAVNTPKPSFQARGPFFPSSYPCREVIIQREGLILRECGQVHTLGPGRAEREVLGFLRGKWIMEQCWNKPHRLGPQVSQSHSQSLTGADTIAKRLSWADAMWGGV